MYESKSERERWIYVEEEYQLHSPLAWFTLHPLHHYWKGVVGYPYNAKQKYVFEKTPVHLTPLGATIEICCNLSYLKNSHYGTHCKGGNNIPKPTYQMSSYTTLIVVPTLFEVNPGARFGSKPIDTPDQIVPLFHIGNPTMQSASPSCQLINTNRSYIIVTTAGKATLPAGTISIMKC